MIAHANILTKETAKLLLTYVQIKSLLIPQGVQSHCLDNILLGQIPNRLILGFMKNRAFFEKFHYEEKFSRFCKNPQRNSWTRRNYFQKFQSIGSLREKKLETILIRLFNLIFKNGVYN